MLSIVSFKFYLQLKMCCFVFYLSFTVQNDTVSEFETRWPIPHLSADVGKVSVRSPWIEFDTWHHKIINRQICNLHKCDVDTRCALEVKFEIHASSQYFEINSTCTVIDSEFQNKRERFFFFFLLGNIVQENKSQTNYWSKQSIFMPLIIPGGDLYEIQSFHESINT